MGASMAAIYANINPDIVGWARQRSHLSASRLAKSFGIPEEKLVKWERGEKFPTLKQARNIASKTHIPLGYLYLDQPPEEQLELPDLRTLNSNQPTRPSPELLELVSLMHERASWYADYLREQGITTNACVGRRRDTDSVIKIVNDIRHTLDIPESGHRGNQDRYFKLLIDRIENAGILVMKQATIHNRRRLSVAEFRGFAISDPVAPLIFINFADVRCACLFTLIHELAHIWLGQSGISDASAATEQTLEVKCNAIAAQFLVPVDEFLQSWQELEDWKQNINNLKHQFHTSRWVIARRAQSLGKITLAQYHHYTAELTEEYRSQDKPTGGNYYVTKNSQISRPFSKAIVSEALSGKVLLREAGQLLDMSPPNIIKYADELGL